MHHASRHHEHTLVFHLGLGIVPLLQQAVRAGRLPEVGCTDGVPLADPGLATHTQAHRLEEKLFLVRVRNAGFEGALIVHLCPCCAEPGSVVLHEFNGDVRALMRW
ncbi:MAG TPA: hypothetical protein RMF84_13645, partial [Polyangiaceae bacterium LLY-WYZ-14_1]|nr:hypothetical protein [Polyangiaceae bacterium LLY-WYZ-14_1]